MKTIESTDRQQVPVTDAVEPARSAVREPETTGAGLGEDAAIDAELAELLKPLKLGQGLVLAY